MYNRVKIYNNPTVNQKKSIKQLTNSLNKLSDKILDLEIKILETQAEEVRVKSDLAQAQYKETLKPKKKKLKKKVLKKVGEIKYTAPKRSIKQIEYDLDRQKAKAARIKKDLDKEKYFIRKYEFQLKQIEEKKAEEQEIAKGIIAGIEYQPVKRDLALSISSHINVMDVYEVDSLKDSLPPGVNEIYFSIKLLRSTIYLGNKNKRGEMINVRTEMSQGQYNFMSKRINVDNTHIIMSEPNPYPLFIFMSNMIDEHIGGKINTMKNYLNSENIVVKVLFKMKFKNVTKDLYVKMTDKRMKELKDKYDKKMFNDQKGIMRERYGKLAFASYSRKVKDKVRKAKKKGKR